MIDWLKHLHKRWNDWCGDRDMELAIRGHLSEIGYFGQTAQLSNVRIVAVQRPGWLQVFRFEARARVRPQLADDAPDPPPQYRDLFGLVREDFRRESSTVRVFEHARDRRELFA